MFDLCKYNELKNIHFSTSSCWLLNSTYGPHSIMSRSVSGLCASFCTWKRLSMCRDHSYELCCWDTMASVSGVTVMVNVPCSTRRRVCAFSSSCTVNVSAERKNRVSFTIKCKVLINLETSSSPWLAKQLLELLRHFAFHECFTIIIWINLLRHKYSFVIRIFKCTAAFEKENTDSVLFLKNA